MFQFQKLTLNPLKTALIFLLFIFLSGCVGKTLIQKRNLQVSSKMSASIFLDPRAPEEKIAYIEIRNTSDKQIFIKDRVEQKIRGAGYRLTNNPNEANYILQVNILQVGKMDLRSNSSMLAAGFGGALVGAGAAHLVSNSNNDYTNAGLLGAGIGLALDALVKDINYTVITDLQIKERVAKGQAVSQNFSAEVTQGTSSKVSQVSHSNSDWKIYQTRIVSTANKVNLKFSEAIGPLTKGLANSIGGIF